MPFRGKKRPRGFPQFGLFRVSQLRFLGGLVFQQAFGYCLQGSLPQGLYSMMFCQICIPKLMECLYLRPVRDIQLESSGTLVTLEKAIFVFFLVLIQTFHWTDKDS